jgi:hypothetical protein
MNFRRRSLREIEQRKVKKRSGIFRSVSGLSNHSRPDIHSESRPTRERIRVSVGRRNMEALSEHPISAIWADNEHRNSPLNILEPTFEEFPSRVVPTAPENAIIEGSILENQPTQTPTEPVINIEEELINELRRIGSVVSLRPSPSKQCSETGSVSRQTIPPDDPKLESLTIPSTSEEPFLFSNSPSTSLTTTPNTSPLKIEKPIATTSNDAKCVVCLDGAKEIVFQPCWHQITCPDCAVRLKECPLCREIIAVRRRPYRC